MNWIPSQKSGMFLYVFLSEVWFLYVCGNGWDQKHVLCMFYYDWFPLTSIWLVPTHKLVIAFSTVLKCAESLAVAKAATLTAARKRQHWPQGGSIGLAAARRRQQWTQQAAALATARRPQKHRPQQSPQRAGHSTGHSCRKQHWPQRAGHRAQAAAIAAARRPQHRSHYIRTFTLTRVESFNSITYSLTRNTIELYLTIFKTFNRNRWRLVLNLFIWLYQILAAIG